MFWLGFFITAAILLAGAFIADSITHLANVISMRGSK